MVNTPTVYVICDQNCKFEGMTKEQILTAITQAIETGTISNVDAGFITTIKTINNIALKFFVGEQAAYDELSEEQKNNLFAIITNDTTKDGILNAIEQVEATFENELNNVQNNISNLQNMHIKEALKILQYPMMNEAETKIYFPVGTLLTLKVNYNTYSGDNIGVFSNLNNLRIQKTSPLYAQVAEQLTEDYMTIMGTWRVIGKCGELEFGDQIKMQDYYYLICCVE